MKTYKLTALALLTGLLTACGGGGSGGSSSDNKPAPQPVNTEVAKPNTTTSTPANQPVAKPATKPATQPTAQPTTQPAAKPATQPTAQPTTQSVAKPATQPIAKPATTSNPLNNKPTTKPVNNPAVEPNTTLNNGLFIEQRKFDKGELQNVDIEFGTVTGFNNDYSFSGAWVEPQEMSEIEVEGKSLVVSKFASLGGLKGIALSNAISTLWNVAKNPNRDVFYFGSETPASKIDELKGTAIYIGNATRYDNINAVLGNVGQAILTADFDNKKISGDLKLKGLRRDISLKETDIKGNGFSGKAVAGENSLFTTRTGTYEGKFFGPNAEEIAGKATFNKELKDLDTSFSGKKR